jgi:transcriptional regulator with XRE-family HTH domain
MARNKFALAPFREKLDLTQLDLADLFRVTKVQISHLESGNRSLVGDALMAYTRMKLVLHHADTSKSLKAYLPTEDTSGLVEKLEARNKILREMIESKQTALDEMKLAHEANISAMSYLNFAIDHAQSLTSLDRVWLRKQIIAKTKALERYGLAAQHTLLIGIARLRVELEENGRVVGDGT